MAKRAYRLKVSHVDRFWTKVNKTETCWLWLGRTDRDGYGDFHMDGRAYRAHRMSWTLVNGPIASGLLACHKCDNPTCVNPDHLFLGTHDANMADMKSKGRQLRSCEEHPLAKMKNNDVLEVRRLLGERISQSRVAKMFGVSQATISYINTRATWRTL